SSRISTLVIWIVSWSFFFFQAEDGIRDFHVTGVQTCALPICHGPAALPGVSAAGAQPHRGGPDRRVGARRQGNAAGRALCLVSRSEERRVGKECRSRG